MHPIASSAVIGGRSRPVTPAYAEVGPWPLRLARLALGLAVLVVLLGGWTRLNDAGLSCPDWPGCYGELVLPGSAEGQALAQSRYPSIPIDHTRAWLEMSHRYLAAVLGLMILLLACLAYRQADTRADQAGIPYPRRLCYLLLALVVAQGLFGMWTVTLKLLPQVVTLHLLGGLMTVTLLVLLNHRLGGLVNRPVSDSDRLDPALGSSDSSCSVRRQINIATSGFTAGRWVGVAVLLLLVQIGLGGWTSSNYAGWACPHWFSCQPVEPLGSQVAKLDFNAGFSLPSADQQSFLGGRKSPQARAAIQMTHRGMALLLLLYLVAMLIRFWHQRRLRVAAIAAFGLAMLQAMLGGLNVIYGLPLGLAFAHHLGALLLLLVLLRLYRLSGLWEKERTYG